MNDYDLAIVTPKYPPDTGGAATYYRLLSAELKESEAVRSLSVLTTVHPSRPFRETNGNRTVYRILPRTSSRGTLLRPFSFLLKQLILLMALTWYCFTYQETVVQIHSTVTFVGRLGYNLPLDWGFRVLRAVTRCRFVLDVRDMSTIPPSAPGFAAVICGSRGIHERCRRKSNIALNRLVEIPVPVDIDGIRTYDRNERLASSLPERYLAFVGDISAAKGAPLLVEAISGMDSNPPVVILGNPVDKAGRQLVRSLPEGAVHLGSRPHDDALQVIDGAEMLVLPSVSEGFPRVVLEAIVLGTPALLTVDVPELSEADIVRILDTRSLSTLRRAIGEEWSEPRGTYWIERHDVGRVCADTVTLHRSLLS
ncbi:glycosyltransferase family 4 protein [Haloarcula marina]|uniref:glycosyltransferase family 4 protein n=1 Tax=Haloarcula marina TaxID=2961574 RepID=UPI0020B75BC8|nr:glycosyltransferase family 4 protein [Halomicroarcula marina]